MSWLPDELNLGGFLGMPAWVSLSLGISFASLGAGLLSGRGGMPFVLGGVLAWWVIAPLAVSLGMVPSPDEVGLSAATAAYEEWITWDVLYAQMLRPLGIGILIGGASRGGGELPGAPERRGLSTSKAGLGTCDELPASALYWDSPGPSVSSQP